MQQVDARRACSPRVTVLLVGHSYIRRFREYMRKHPELANLGFDDVDLYCVGDGVKTVGPGHRPIRARLRDVEAYQPCLVFMHIGEDMGSMTPGNITWELTQLVNELIPLCSTLIVGQLLSFPGYRPHHHQDVTLINAYLRRDVPRPRVFWRHQ